MLTVRKREEHKTFKKVSIEYEIDTVVNSKIIRNIRENNALS